MMRFLLSRILLPAFLLALAPSLPALAVAIDQGDILRWLVRAPWAFWVPFSLLAGDILLLLVLRGRSRSIRLNTRARLARFWLRLKRGGTPPRTVEHDGILWSIRVTPHPEGRAEIHVSPTPLCPMCEARLEHRAGWLFHRWRCTQCGYHRLSRYLPGEQAAHLRHLATEVRDAPGCVD